MSVNKKNIFDFKSYKYIWIALLSLLLAAPIFLHLDSKPLREWDEARNAINAFEMSKSGNFLVRTYNNHADLWETKPPLLVWLQTIGFKLFGYNELAVRLPSALSTFVLCLFLVFWFSKNYEKTMVGIFASLIIITSLGYMSEHAARTGDHDALLICFTILALLNIFQYFENFNKKSLAHFFVFFTLAVLTKSIVILLILPGLFIYSIYKKKALSTIKDLRVWKGFGLSIVFIAGFYIAREIKDPGYLSAVWHNELFPRYLNQSDRYQYNQTDFWYYYRELQNWQFKYWFPFIFPSIIISISLYQKTLRNLAIFITIQIILFFLIISNGSSNVWYDLLLIPLMAIVIGMSIYKILELIYYGLNLKSYLSKMICFALALYIFYSPYENIMQKVLSNEEISSQVMYGYAFKRIEIEKPQLKNFKIYKPLGYNYPLVFYSKVYNSTKGYKIENIDDSELATFKGYILLLNEQIPEFNKHNSTYTIRLKDPFYTFLEL